MSRILITGCSKGLGRATAIELARRGYEVIATARNPETLTDLPAAAGLALDVTDAESVRGLADASGPIDVLVNNAAEIAIGPLVLAGFRSTRRRRSRPVGDGDQLLRTARAQPRVRSGSGEERRRRHGAMVNMLSVLSWVTVPNSGAYSASKAATWALTNWLRTSRREQGTIRTAPLRQRAELR